MKFSISILLVLLLVIVGVAQDEEEPTPTPNCAPAIKINELTFTSIKELRAQLDSFGLQVNTSNALGVVIGYGGKETNLSEGLNIANEVDDYLTARFGFTSSVLKSRNGGHRGERTIELFIKYASCGDDPIATPTLLPDEVNYKEEQQFFDKSIVRKTDSELRSLVESEVPPLYPPAARAIRATGKVIVMFVVDEKGSVIKVKAIDGHPLLRTAAENSVRLSSFQKLLVNKKAVKFGGKVVIDFAPLLEQLNKNEHD